MLQKCSGLRRVVPQTTNKVWKVKDLQEPKGMMTLVGFECTAL